MLSQMSETSRQLRAAAERAFAAGRHQQALAQSIRLEREEPEEPAWPRYTALICQTMGRTLDQIDALDRAAGLHQKRGEILKAATVCKHILAIDPQHSSTRARIQALRAARAPSLPPPVRASPAPRRWETGEGLAQVPLRSVMPGARRSSESAPAGPAVYTIPLDSSSVESSVELSLSREPSSPPKTSRPGSGAVLPTGMPTPQVVGGTPDIELTVEDAAVLAVAEELRAVQRTERALLDTPLFRDMAEAAFHALIDRSGLRRVEADEHVFLQGAPGDALYVIAEGEVGVIDEGPPRRGLAKLGEGSFFGEMALVSDAPRSATCTALTDCELIVIDRATLKALIQSHPDVLTVILRFLRDRSVDRILRTSPLFTSLSRQDLEKVRPHFHFLEIEPGADLIVEGTRPSGVMIMVAGRAEVLRSGERVGVLFPDDVAGEMSLLKDAPAGATVRATEKLLAVSFPSKGFKRILEARPSVRAYVEEVMKKRQAGPNR